VSDGSSTDTRTENATPSAVRELQRMAGFSGAVLLVIGLATGGLLAMAMTGKANADAHDVLAAHLNAILGCFWICALAFTLPFASFGETALRRLVLVTIVPNYANWLITTIKAFLKVAGVGLKGEPHNDAVFGALNVFVVLPALVAAIAWAWGLNKRPKS
jgi:hydroxylaminobenzene mutase